MPLLYTIRAEVVGHYIGLARQLPSPGLLCHELFRLDYYILEMVVFRRILCILIAVDNWATIEGDDVLIGVRVRFNRRGSKSEIFRVNLKFEARCSCESIR
jgi:hypothetical protein